MNGEKISWAENPDKGRLEQYRGYNDGELEAILRGLKASGGTYEYDGVNGKCLLNPTMSIDEVYQEVLGCSKEEYAKKALEFNRSAEEEKRRQEAEAEKKIPEWIERGKALVYPEKFENWTAMVEARAKGIFYGEDVEDALVVMEQLEAGVPVEEIKMSAGGKTYIGSTFGSANAIIFAFSKRGPEFITKMLDNLSSGEVMKITDMKRQNSRLAELSPLDELDIQEERSAS